jgi:4-diphosphocytidyl-2-C-methyl-D-erythritol kinase
MILYPNAKINLGLNILSKRDDGFHNLISVFYPLHNYFDILEIVPATKFLFTTSGLNIPGKTNLCEKAYALMNSKYNINPIHIHLHKNIPIGSGLGGGSSDASYVLKGINQLFNLNIDNCTLQKISLEIGADCPFFIQNKVKLVSGIGDVMNDIDLDISEYEIRVINTGIHISTKEAFSEIVCDNTNNSLQNLAFLPIEKWKYSITNDFEKNIFNKYPKIKESKQKLYDSGAIYSSMTGTGSAVYGVFKKS